MMCLFTSGTSPSIWFIPSVEHSENLHIELSITWSFYECPPNFEVWRFDCIAVENIVKKGEIACNKQFLLFSQFFSTLYGTYFPF